MSLFDEIHEDKLNLALREQDLPSKSHICSQNNNKFVNE